MNNDEKFDKWFLRNKIGGLTELPPDSRDFALGQLVVYPKLSELPESFSLVTPELNILDQNADENGDMCSAYTTCGISALQEGVDLFPPFSFAASKEISGEPESWGQNLRDAFAAHIKHGAIEPEKVPDAEKNLTQNERRYFKNYSLATKAGAIQHIKKAYVMPKGIYDAYDNCRASLWLYRNEKRAIGFGVEFGWTLDTYILSGTPSGFGHAMYITGWDKDGLEVVNSAGKNAGKNGFHRITRETIEEYVKKYGAYMYIDASPEEIKQRIQGQLSIIQTIINFIKMQLSFISSRIQSMKAPIVEPIIIKPPEPPPPPEVIIPNPEPKYLWNTYENARHSTRVICDEEGLTVFQKNQLTETIKCESGFKPDVIHINANGTKDCGIAQLNEKYYLTPNNMTCEDAISDPEKCIRITARAFKKGREHDWICWRKIYGI